MWGGLSVFFKLIGHHPPFFPERLISSPLFHLPKCSPQRRELHSHGAKSSTPNTTSFNNSTVLTFATGGSKLHHDFMPTPSQLLKNPPAAFAIVPRDAAVFSAGAGAAAKTFTAPLDRIKLLMQVLMACGLGKNSAKKAISFIQAIAVIGKEEGIQGYWKGNLPQVIRVVPYSAVQLFAYEIYKKIFRGENGRLSVAGRLAAGAFAGMTSTFITYPLDVLRLRLAVEPGYWTMSEMNHIMASPGCLKHAKGGRICIFLPWPWVFSNCNSSLYCSELLNHCLRNIKRELKHLYSQLSFRHLSLHLHAILWTQRRQMQLKGTPYKTVLDALSGIVARDGVAGLYRGFVPNALKSLPNSSIKLTTYGIVKRLITASEKEFQTITEENRNKHKNTNNQ
ncbi:Thylakoid ADP,ATP carrier protein, chloroplastic [Glycine soja]